LGAGRFVGCAWSENDLSGKTGAHRSGNVGFDRQFGSILSPLLDWSVGICRSRIGFCRGDRHLWNGDASGEDALESGERFCGNKLSNQILFPQKAKLKQIGFPCDGLSKTKSKEQVVESHNEGRFGCCELVLNPWQVSGLCL